MVEKCSTKIYIILGSCSRFKIFISKWNLFNVTWCENFLHTFKVIKNYNFVTYCHHHEKMRQKQIENCFFNVIELCDMHARMKFNQCASTEFMINFFFSKIIQSKFYGNKLRSLKSTKFNFEELIFLTKLN